LPVANGQGMVFVGLGAQGLVHEEVARHLAHCREHGVIRNAAILDLFPDHTFAAAFRINVHACVLRSFNACMVMYS